MSTPKGFVFSAACAGFRKQDRNDVGMVVSETPAVTAAVFTQNLYPAAPVIVGRELLLAHTTARAVMINSGQANACTGPQGIADCKATQRLAAEAFGLRPEDILPASTGVIGPRLKMDLWANAVLLLKANLGTTDAEGFDRAIITTDAFPKLAEAEVRLAGGTVRLQAVAKGAGMICPNMATMLCVLMCDARIDAPVWRALLREAVDLTFNRVTVDGDTSTNDTVYALANGASLVDVTPDDLPALKRGMVDVLGKIAYMLVRDGEGARNVAHISVKGAKTAADAEQVARTIGHSQLVKTAIYGRDANWGRIVAAVGRAGVPLDPNAVKVRLCGVLLFENGQPTADDFDAVLAEPMKGHDIAIDVLIGDGPAEYELLAADLGHEYVNVNADYRS